MGSEAVDPAMHELAWRLARACRRVVRSCLREEEWADADREFYATILMGLLHHEAVDITEIRSFLRKPADRSEQK